jgi:drug/metabolite transporter (DMT)-like permease
LVGLGPALLAWQTPSVSSLPVVVALVASGTVAQLMMTRAYQLAPAAQVGPFIYGSVAFAAVFDWLIFSRHPDGPTTLGAALVVAAGVLSLRGGRRMRAEA